MDRSSWPRDERGSVLVSLGHRVKHSSKQYTVRSRAMAKAISKENRQHGRVPRNLLELVLSHTLFQNKTSASVLAQPFVFLNETQGSMNTVVFPCMPGQQTNQQTTNGTTWTYHTMEPNRRHTEETSNSPFVLFRRRPPAISKTSAASVSIRFPSKASDCLKTSNHVFFQPEQTLSQLLLNTCFRSTIFVWTFESGLDAQTHLFL